MLTKKIFFISLVAFMHLSYGKCNRSDRAHVNENVLRCTYHQEDIYRCYREKTGCYKNEQERNECFFCGCPIEEHTKLKDGKKKKKAAASKK